MIILLYIAQLVVLFDDSVLSNSWMIDLLALFGINPGSGKTKDWVSSTRGILPAAYVVFSNIGENFNHFTFSCFNYIAQITRMSFVSLIHNRKKIT